MTLTSLAEIGAITDRERLLEIACTAFESRGRKGVKALRAMLSQQDLAMLQDLTYSEAWKAWPHLHGESFAQPNVVAAKLRQGYEALLPLLPQWGGDQKALFLDEVASKVDRWHAEKLSGSASELKDRFADIERSARELKRHISNLDGQGHALFVAAYDGVLSGGMHWVALPPLEDSLTALDHYERAAREAGEQFKPQKGETVRNLNARRLVRLVANAHRAMFGEWPPASKGGWFAPFIRQLAEVYCGIEIGFDLIEGVVVEEKSG